MVSTSPVFARAMTSSPQAAGLRLSAATDGPCRQVSRPAMSLRKSLSTVAAACTAWHTVLSSSSTTRMASSISPRVRHSTRTAITTPLRLRRQRVSGRLFHFRPTPSLTGARSPRRRRRRGFGRPVPLPPDTSLTAPLSLVFVRSPAPNWVLRTAIGPARCCARLVASPNWQGSLALRSSRAQHRCAALEKGGDDLLEKDILVQEDRAFGYFPPSHRVAPQHIIALPHEQVHLIVQPVAVDNKPARHVHFVALHVDDPHVGHDVADARHRLLAPVHAGVELADPPGQDSLVLVDPRDL